MRVLGRFVLIVIATSLVLGVGTSVLINVLVNKSSASSEDAIRSGQAAFDNKDYTTALTWYRVAADQGNATAQYKIGLIYAAGYGVRQDYAEALIWLRKAADAGLAEAQYELGLMYRDGKGVEKNAAEAANWLGKSASHGNADAKKALEQLQPTIAANDTPRTPAPPSTPNNIPAYRPGKVNIVITGAVPGAYENGRAGKCVFAANVHNNTKYHVDNISFKVDTWEFKIDEMNANTYVDDEPIFTVTLGQYTCYSQAAYLIESIGRAGVFDCSMPGIAEGDCQDMVLISTTMDLASVQQVRANEISLGEKQIAPVRAALIAAELDTSNFRPYSPQKLSRYTQLLDTIVRVDSQSWYSNRYSAGTIYSVKLVDETVVGLTLEASYTFYAGGQRPADGWVKVKFSRTDMPCLIYHDFPDTCRAINFPQVSDQK